MSALWPDGLGCSLQCQHPIHAQICPGYSASDTASRLGPGKALAQNRRPLPAMWMKLLPPGLPGAVTAIVAI